MSLQECQCQQQQQLKKLLELSDQIVIDKRTQQQFQDFLKNQLDNLGDQTSALQGKKKEKVEELVQYDDYDEGVKFPLLEPCGMENCWQNIGQQQQFEQDVVSGFDAMNLQNIQQFIVDYISNLQSINNNDYSGIGFNQQVFEEQLQQNFEQSVYGGDFNSYLWGWDQSVINNNNSNNQQDLQLKSNELQNINNNNCDELAAGKEKLERELKIFKYKSKKRNWQRTISYDCRKRVADNRVRVKGRFVSKKQQEGGRQLYQDEQFMQILQRKIQKKEKIFCVIRKGNCEECEGNSKNKNNCKNNGKV